MLSPRQIQGCKPQFDGNPALFFLLQPVRIRSADRLYQAGFTMVNMPGRTENYLFHRSTLPYNQSLEILIKAITQKSDIQFQFPPVLFNRPGGIVKSSDARRGNLEE
jgi:hypothetical protein